MEITAIMKIAKSTEYVVSIDGINLKAISV